MHDKFLWFDFCIRSRNKHTINQSPSFGFLVLELIFQYVGLDWLYKNWIGIIGFWQFLILQAYECLSNSDKRRVFDLERWRNTCIECNSNDVNTKSGLKHNKVWQTSDESRSNRSVLRGLKDIRDRFREETRVIENCLRMNAAPKKEQASLFDSSDYLFGINTRTQKESPVFNPSNYKCQSYPHLRTQIYKNNMDKFWYFGRGKCDSPIFEVKSDRGTFKSKSTCVHS